MKKDGQHPGTAIQGGLRRVALRGTAYVSSRQLAGFLIGGTATILLTRILGPVGYGSYAIALSLALYLQSLADWGIDVYLMRAPLGNDVGRLERQATALLLLFGLLGTGLALAALLALELIPTISDLKGPIAVMLMLTPIVLLAQVPLARLERNLRYRAVALCELTAQLIFASTAVTLAYLGLGVWAMVIAYAIQQLVFAVAIHIIAQCRPRIAWDRGDARDILSYGLGYSASLSVWQLRTLMVPLVVAPILGPAAAGVIALSIRLADMLSFIKSAAWRLSLPLLARIADTPSRLGRAVSDGMLLQFVGAGVPAVIFCVAGIPLVERALGSRWHEVSVVFPFIAGAYMVNAVFSMQSSALYVLRKNWAVTAFHASFIVLFFGASLALLPGVGVVGYGIAELCAILHTLCLFERSRYSDWRLIMRGPSFGCSL